MLLSRIKMEFRFDLFSNETASDVNIYVKVRRLSNFCNNKTLRKYLGVKQRT